MQIMQVMKLCKMLQIRTPTLSAFTFDHIPNIMLQCKQNISRFYGVLVALWELPELSVLITVTIYTLKMYFLGRLTAVWSIVLWGGL